MGCTTMLQNGISCLDHMLIMGIVTYHLQGIVTFNGTAQIKVTTIKQRPATVISLMLS